MPELLFNLRNVPEDEREEVRALLRANAIDYYETPAGNWGISSPGLWLADVEKLERARALLAEYQHQRAAAAREQYRRLQALGRAERLSDRIAAEPLRSLFYVALIGLVLYLSVSPFLSLD